MNIPLFQCPLLAVLRTEGHDGFPHASAIAKSRKDWNRVLEPGETLEVDRAIRQVLILFTSCFHEPGPVVDHLPRGGSALRAGTQRQV